MGGAAIVFFAFIGFDAVSTTAEETRNPQRDLPIGMITSLIVCTILYVGVAAVLTGMKKYTAFVDDAAAIATAVEVTRKPWVQAVDRRRSAGRIDIRAARLSTRATTNLHVNGSRWSSPSILLKDPPAFSDPSHYDHLDGYFCRFFRAHHRYWISCRTHQHRHSLCFHSRFGRRHCPETYGS